MNLASELAESEKAEVVLATDPDADRIGMALRDENGQYVLLNGNQTCSLLVYYIVKRWSELGRLRGKENIVKTIVTTEQVARIAEERRASAFWPRISYETRTRSAPAHWPPKPPHGPSRRT